MQVDYLIAGQGLAGSWLAWFLMQHGKRVLVADARSGAHSSRVAAGIINPVTGKKMVLTWLADELFPFAHSIYPQLERFFDKRFFFPLPVVRVFNSAKQANDWSVKAADPEAAPFIDEDFRPDIGQLNAPHGHAVFRYGGWLDTEIFLDEMRSYLEKSEALTTQNIAYDDLDLRKEDVRWKDVEARHVIFCEGWRVKENPWFRHLEIYPNKGEVLTIHCPGLNQQAILNKGVFLLPLGNGLFRAGSTYEWDRFDLDTTEEGRTFITKKIKSLVRLPFEVTDQQAGLRPATQDRRPFIGTHPEESRLHIFNGLGTKGVTLAPYFARQMAAYLVFGSELHPEVAVGRYDG